MRESKSCKSIWLLGSGQLLGVLGSGRARRAALIIVVVESPRSLAQPSKSVRTRGLQRIGKRRASQHDSSAEANKDCAESTREACSRPHAQENKACLKQLSQKISRAAEDDAWQRRVSSDSRRCEVRLTSRTACSPRSPGVGEDQAPSPLQRIGRRTSSSSRRSAWAAREAWKEKGVAADALD